MSSPSTVRPDQCEHLLDVSYGKNGEPSSYYHSRLVDADLQRDGAETRGQLLAEYRRQSQESRWKNDSHSLYGKCPTRAVSQGREPCGWRRRIANGGRASGATSIFARQENGSSSDHPTIGTLRYHKRDRYSTSSPSIRIP